MLEALTAQGYDLPEQPPESLEQRRDDLADFHVIVALVPELRKNISELPFHTTLLDWSTSTSEPAKSQPLETLHRSLGNEVTELMELLRGSEAS